MNTPRLITDAANRVVWRWDHDEPFGNNLPDENPSGAGTFTYNPRFPGQYWDKETGLHYNYFRDYDPSTGRYLQSDPIELAGDINTYAYANRNPLSLTDHEGLFLEWMTLSLADLSSPPDVSCNPDAENWRANVRHQGGTL